LPSQGLKIKGLNKKYTNIRSENFHELLSLENSQFTILTRQKTLRERSLSKMMTM